MPLMPESYAPTTLATRLQRAGARVRCEWGRTKRIDNNNNQICGSIHASSSSLTRKWRFSTPVKLTLTCFNKATFSPSFIHLACMGVSGRKTKTATPIMNVTTPRTKNMILHPAKGASTGICWKAHERRPPKIWPMPRPKSQNEIRGACSDLVYH